MLERHLSKLLVYFRKLGRALIGGSLEMNEYIANVILGVKFSVAWVGKNLEEIGAYSLMVILGYGVCFLVIGPIHKEYKLSWLHSHMLVFSGAFGIIALITGINYLKKWGNKNYDKLKKEIDVKKSITDTYFKALAIEGLKPNEPAVRDEGITKVALESKLSSEELSRIGAEIVKFSDSAAHYKRLSEVIEQEKNKVLEEAKRYKDLYERLLVTDQILSRQNEELKEQLNRNSRNAIEDLE